MASKYKQSYFERERETKWVRVDTAEGSKGKKKARGGETDRQREWEREREREEKREEGWKKRVILTSQQVFK